MRAVVKPDAQQRAAVDQTMWKAEEIRENEKTRESCFSLEAV